MIKSILLILFLIGSCTQAQSPFVLVLGTAQDGGIPQAGSPVHLGDDGNPIRSHVVSLALVDPVDSLRWLFEATPDLRDQLRMIDRAFPVNKKAPGLAGVFLTHAHMGHYTGLMFLGYESMSSSRVPVWAMPRLSAYLKSNGPWSQLVRYENILLQPLEQDVSVTLNDRLSVTPILVPHRQEYSEVVGFCIEGPEKKVLFIPDIDGWEEWDTWGVTVEDLIRSVDIAYLDATFFADGELPGRDMSGVPHPLMMDSMNRFSDMSEYDRSKIRFIHFNHTNPVIHPEGDARQFVLKRGFNVAEQGERVEL